MLVPATEDNIGRAGHLIQEGHLVAFPTETVYGLGGDATNSKAVALIFATKGRPRFNPLIVHVPSLEVAEKIGKLTPEARILASAFWPGPLTLVVQRHKESTVCELATAGLTTIALRVPCHPVAQALLKAANCPIAAPSANRSGRVSPTRADHVLEDFKDQVRMILDGGTVQYGLESTVVNASGEELEILRPGILSIEEIITKVGYKILPRPSASSKSLSPGHLESHYAPKAKLRLDASDAKKEEALLAFGSAAPSQGIVINLSPDGNLIEAAANLYTALRALDHMGVKTIAVMSIPETGIGEAINDRLRRAAAPRN